MKNLLLILLLLPLIGNSQKFVGFNSDCGTWVEDTVKYSTWINTDTLKLNLKGDTTWIYSEWKTEGSNMITLVYCPCGCGYSVSRYQDRINDVGIIQRMYEITSFKYIPKPLTEFEKKKRQLK